MCLTIVLAYVLWNSDNTQHRFPVQASVTYMTIPRNQRCEIAHYVGDLENHIWITVIGLA